MNEDLLDRRNKGACVSIASISSNWSEIDDKGDLDEASPLEPDFEDTVDQSGGSVADG